MSLVICADLDLCLQRRRPLQTELAVKYKDSLLGAVTTDARGWLHDVGAEEVFLERGRVIDVDGAGNMAPIVLVIESAINNLERRYFRVVRAIQELVQLSESQRPGSRGHDFSWSSLSGS